MEFYFGNPHHPYPYYDHSIVDNNIVPSSPDEITLSDYLMLDDYVDHHQESRSSQSTESSEKATFSDATHGATSKDNNMQVLFLSLISLPSLKTRKWYTLLICIVLCVRKFYVHVESTSV